ncbi:hypothetical protein [Acinetobacter johnsonii]|uniref:hypothetical protein n=1 Tax=Acinetobacter johnsonii TaxID=40214 RepID=UPI003AF4AD70
MDIEKERAAFEAWYCGNYTGLKQSDLVKFRTLSGYSFGDPLKIDVSWEAWQAAKSQAVPEGFVLVPKEPTLKMSIAYQKNAIAPVSSLSISGYKAMITAAQEPAND